jgi:hypothetical protein
LNTSPAPPEIARVASAPHVGHAAVFGASLILWNWSNAWPFAQRNS